MGIGEAAVTVLSERGAPTPVAWTRLRPPASLMAQLDAAEHTRIVAGVAAARGVRHRLDRESAYERLLAKVARRRTSRRRSPPRRRAPDAAAERAAG